MNYPTEDQLNTWRQQGKTYAQIAQMTGRSPGTIKVMCSRLKISPRRRAIPQDQIKIICRMRQEGYRTKEIVEETGYSESTVYEYLKAAGLINERNLESELPLIFAKPRKPKIRKVIYHGKTYIDVTDLYIAG